MLEGIEYPDDLLYLLGWFNEVYGRSGVGMSGLAPLSYSTVAEWSRLTGIVPTMEEVHALFALDAARRYPGEPEKDDA